MSQKYTDLSAGRRSACFSPRFTFSLLAAASLLAFAAAPVRAQQDDSTAANEDSGAIEEILVTATKRGVQRLQDVAMAISALSGDTLRDMGAQNFMDYAGQIPGLQFQDLGPGDKEYIIRGGNSVGASTSGVYFDEAVITGRNKEDGGGRQPDPKLYDIQRIEVLKGPQGTLYGSSSMTGTIRIITNKPDPTKFEGNVEGEISGTRKGGSNYNFHAMVNFPVIEDKLAVRAVGWINDNSGFIDQVRLPNKNINTDNVEGGRFSLRAFPSESLTVTLSATVQNMTSGGSSRFTPGSAFFAVPVPGFPNVQGCDLCNVDFTESRWDENMQIYSATFDWQLEHGELLATTNFFRRTIDFNFDGTPVLFALFDLFLGGVDLASPSVTFQPQRRKMWSNEIRYSSDLEGPVNFVVGGFLSREDKFFDVQVFRANDLGFPTGAFSTAPEADFFAGGSTIFGRNRNISTNQEALFGEVNVAVTDVMEVIGGIRYFNSDIDDLEQAIKPFGGFPPDSGPAEDSFKLSEDKVTYKTGVNFHVNEDQLIYLVAAQGFREGGINDVGIPAVAQIPRFFKQDSLWNYEVGAKTSWLNNSLIFNVAAFFTRWNNIHTVIKDPTGAFQFVANGGDVSIDGIEVELISRPTSKLEFKAGISYTDARLTTDAPFAAGQTLDDGSFFQDPNAGLKGDQVPNIPDWQFGISGAYHTPVFDGSWEATTRFDLSFMGDRGNQFRPNSPFFVALNQYTVVNFQFILDNGSWRAAFFANNLTDKRAQIDAIRSQQDPLGFLTIRPRTVGGRLAKSF